MSCATDAWLCFGYLFPEGQEFPWGNDDPEDWWFTINKYEPPFDMYDEQGRLREFTREEMSEYCIHSNQWFAANPLPFEIINYGDDFLEMYILALPSSIRIATSKKPTKIENELHYLPAEAIKLVHFFEQHGLTPTAPSWWLVNC